MAQHQTSGNRVSITPDGKRIHTILISRTTDDAATTPSAPTGTSLVSVEYTGRADGGRDYTYVFESPGPSAGAASSEVSGQASQEPIETHPSFNGADSFGTITTFQNHD